MWIINKIKSFIANTSSAEIDTFIQSLRGLSDEEISLLLAESYIARATCIHIGILPSEAFTNDDIGDGKELSKISYVLSKVIRDQQKQGKLNTAAALMIWLHSARSMLTPEIRIKGREMWGELSRGLYGVRSVLRHKENEGFLIPDKVHEDGTFIPEALEPFSHQLPE